MCGVVGVVADNSQVNQVIYDGLTMLQHRGQDAAGIATCAGDQFFLHKGNGMVRDVFRTRHMLNLLGSMGIGHVRYPTLGCFSAAEAQPFYVNMPYGIAIAHNGNLVNGKELKQGLMSEDRRHLNTDSDSEVLLNIFAHSLYEVKKPRSQVSAEDIFASVQQLHKRCLGSYAVVAMIAGVGIVGFRDPNGIRPLIYGRRRAKNGAKEYIIASESVAINSLGFEVVRDIAPGEAIFISVDGKLRIANCSTTVKHSPCIFEYVYLARPDSILDKISVYKTRLRLGEALAEKILSTYPDHDIEVVIPIPDSGRPAALPLANKLNVKYREGFIRNRYIPRTFIMPGQQVRKKSVRQKLNAIDLEFKGKNVLLVDDSIVRGTTSQKIIQMARHAGAKKVYFAAAAPPIRYPNVYGIDMPVANELIAYNRSTEEVAKIIGADWLIYQDLEALKVASRAGNPEITDFDTSCFDGEYVTGGVTSKYLARLEANRADYVLSKMASEEDDLTDLSKNSLPNVR